jgi:hypothetical protein
MARWPSLSSSHIWRLRRVLEPDRERGEPSTVLIRELGSYRLVIDPDQTDSARFARLAVAAAELLAGFGQRHLRRVLAEYAAHILRTLRIHRRHPSGHRRPSSVARAPSTSTCGGCGPSSAPSTSR